MNVTLRKIMTLTTLFAASLCLPITASAQSGTYGQPLYTPGRTYDVFQSDYNTPRNRNSHDCELCNSDKLNSTGAQSRYPSLYNNDRYRSFNEPTRRSLPAEYETRRFDFDAIERQMREFPNDRRPAISQDSEGFRQWLQDRGDRPFDSRDSRGTDFRSRYEDRLNNPYRYEELPAPSQYEEARPRRRAPQRDNFGSQNGFGSPDFTGRGSNFSPRGNFGRDDFNRGNMMNRDNFNRGNFDRDNLNRPGNFNPADFNRPGNFDSRYDQRDNQRINRYRPAAQPANNGLTQLRSRMSARYRNPVNVRFLKGLNSNQAIQLYDEISQVIDSRHLKPTPYASRVQRAVQHLSEAMNNDAFLAANGLQNAGFKLDSFRHQLSRVNTSTIRNREDARNTMVSLMRSAQSSLGVSPSVVAYEFVAGSTESLDKYSAFEPADRPVLSGAIEQEWKSVGLDDQIVGIGVEIKQHSGGLLINKTLRGGSAYDSGLKKGDVITRINGRNIAGMALSESADMISGQAGTAVMLEIDRQGTKRTLSLRRRSFKLLSINESRMLNDSVAYIKLDKFSRSSSEELDQSLRALHRQGMKSLVLDLRGNPGGLLDECVEICNKFVPCGTIVSTKGRLATDNSTERATYERTWSTPIVVLTDGNSASASEILAAAIQDNKRGVILGEKSYGKGTVQTHFPLTSVSGTLRLTTAKFYSPDGREMAGAGVTPDVRITTSEDAARDNALAEATRIAGTNQLREMAQSSARCRIRSGSADGMFPALTSVN